MKVKLLTLLSPDVRESGLVTFEIVEQNDAINRYDPSSCGSASKSTTMNMWTDPQEVHTAYRGVQRFWLVQNQVGHRRGGAEGEAGEGVDVGVHDLTL